VIPARIFPCNRLSIFYIYSSAITVSTELAAVYAEGCSADDSANDGVWKCCRVKVVQITESGVVWRVKVLQMIESGIGALE
jgi:hypothetical protein